MMSSPTVITDCKVNSESINSESSNNGENKEKTTTTAEVVVDPPAVATAVTEEIVVELPVTIAAPTEKEVVVGPPTTTTPTSPVVTTKSKINTNTNGNSSSSNSTSSSSTKAATTTKPLTVTVNGNDRSKDLNEHDVVCEKGRGDHERWPGNKLYRHLINVNKETYNDLAPIERSNIIGKIIGTIQEKNGWFVSHSEASGNWSRLTEEKVRKKVSDDLRREVRRRREKRSHNSLFSAKLRQIKEMEEVDAAARDILERVDDPRQSDVLFGPGARRHPGNKTYWHHMKLNLDQYIISPYGARSIISRNIVQIIRNQHGRFLEQDPKTGIWYSISDKRALEKTSHALSNMKYKTRKRHPDEPPHMYHTTLGGHPGGPGGGGHGNPHHLAYRVGPYGEEMVYGDEMEDENILEGDSPNTIFAKKRTKKFRLLNRMDDGVVGDQMTPLKGKGSNDDNATPTGGIGGTEKNVNTNANNIDDPTATPIPGLMKEGKVISPNSGSDSIDYQEQRNPNNYRRVQHIPATGMPNPADGNYGAAYRGVEPVGADIAPRISHFDYMKHYGPPPGSNAAAFKTLTYAAGEAYGVHHGHHPPHPHHMRRYLAPNLAVPEQQHGVPPPHVTNNGVGVGAGVPQGGGPLSSSSANIAHEAALAARRRVLKATGPAGYWVSNEWAPPPEAYY